MSVIDELDKQSNESKDRTRKLFRGHLLCYSFPILHSVVNLSMFKEAD